MTGSSSSGSDRQQARNKGLAAISAITLGAGAAGLVGAVGIALTLPGATSSTIVSAGTVASAGRVASNFATFTTDDDSGDDSGAQVQTGTASRQQTATASQLQTGSAPTTTTVPPVATSAAS